MKMRSHSNLNSSLVLQLTPCMALYDTMLSLKSPIGTHCLGFAFNLAGFILAAGEKVLLVNIGFFLEPIVLNMLEYNTYICSFCAVQGSRTGMPLCRISLQSPAGAARGQVYNLNRRPIGLISDACSLESVIYFIFLCRLMILKMKQMSLFVSRTICMANSRSTQVTLSKRQGLPIS